MTISLPPLIWIWTIDFCKWIATVCSKSNFPVELLKWSVIVAVRNSDLVYLTELHLLWDAALRMCFHEMQETKTFFLIIHSWGLHITFRFRNGTFYKRLLKEKWKANFHNLEYFLSYMWVFNCKLAKIMLQNFDNELLNNISKAYVFWYH